MVENTNLMLSKIYITNIKINVIQDIIVDVYPLYIKYNLYSYINYYIKVIFIYYCYTLF